MNNLIFTEIKGLNPKSFEEPSFTKIKGLNPKSFEESSLNEIKEPSPKEIKASNFDELKDILNGSNVILHYGITANSYPSIKVKSLVINDVKVIFDRIIFTEELYIYLSKVNKTFIRYVLEHVKGFTKLVCNFDLDLENYSMPDTLEHIEAPFVGNNMKLKYVKCNRYRGDGGNFVDKLLCKHRGQDDGKGKEMYIEYDEHYYRDEHPADIHGFKQVFFIGFKNIPHYKKYGIYPSNEADIHFLECSVKFVVSIDNENKKNPHNRW